MTCLAYLRSRNDEEPPSLYTLPSEIRNSICKMVLTKPKREIYVGDLGDRYVIGKLLVFPEPVMRPFMKLKLSTLQATQS